MYNGVPLPRDTVVMLWRSWMGVNNLAQAAQQGHAVVMCPQDRHLAGTVGIKIYQDIKLFGDILAHKKHGVGF
jgi:hypothetical protein